MIRATMESNDNEIRHERLELLEGEEFVEAELLTGSDTCSGAKVELELRFTNGRELLIYQHEDGTIIVEAD